MVKWTSSLALLWAAGLMVVSPAASQAADLGGDCCADLEERIAELEATTARKGNRKVSLTVSGWVNEQVLFWDDETESNVYVGGNDQERSRFKLSGKAKINNDLSAGYTLEIGVRTTRSSRYSQDDDEGATGLDIRKSSWYLDSKTFGKLTVGRDGSATYHLLDDSNITNTRYYADAESITTIGIPGFFLRANGVDVGGFNWGDVLSPGATNTPGNGERPDIVRYDTPTFAGFYVSAAWGEDDLWDVALIYKGEVGDFKLAGRIGYAEYTDEGSGPGSGHCAVVNGASDCNEFGLSGTVMHQPTGLFVYGAYGRKQDDLRADLFNANVDVDDEDQIWYVQAGIERRWSALGKTSIFGSYRHDDVGSANDESFNFGANVVDGVVQGTDIDTWSVGVVQNIEAAAMDLYLIYSNVQGDLAVVDSVSGASQGTIDLDTLQLLQAGARIQF